MRILQGEVGTDKLSDWCSSSTKTSHQRKHGLEVTSFANNSSLPTVQAQKNEIGYILSELSPKRQLGSTLKYCFDELEVFYPCIDRVDFYQRLSALFLFHCTCEGRFTKIPLEARHTSLAALTCMLLAAGTYLGGASNAEQNVDSDDNLLQEAMAWHAESRKLLSTFSRIEQPDLDVLRYHLLEVIFMTMLGRRGSASQSRTIAVELAYSLGLNDDRTWAIYTPRAQEYRRLAWWTLYFLDRRVALVYNRPIMIRTADFVVGDFTPFSIEQYTNDASSDASLLLQSTGLQLNWDRPARLPQDFSGWLIFCLRWSKTVTAVWNKIFAVNASQSEMLQAIEGVDALLEACQQDSSLVFECTSDGLPNSIPPGEMERACRRKVLVVEVR